ncbi:MAG TPA: hypothetical protein VGI39_10375 [Polyangiaceae bacterium]|jgi:hypothetical protein
MLTAPSLATGFALDDYLFAVVIRKLPMVVPQTGPLDLFRFGDGKARTVRGLMDLGQIVWTSDPSTRGAFLRPISALTHILDFTAWPFSPALMHAHSLLWFAACLGMTGLLYRRLLATPWIAGLATLLYAVDDVHGEVVAWIANRNALIAYALAAPVLWLHDRQRRDGLSSAAWLGPTFLIAALLAGESAVGIVAYLAAYALHIDEGPWRQRIASLAPHALILAAWRVAYVHFGFGVSGSSIYIDPGRSPEAFLVALPRRLAFLLLGQFAFPRADVGELYEYLSPHADIWAFAFAIAVIMTLGAAIAGLWRRDRITRFFVTGILIACIPISATAPGDRLLLFVSFGAAGLIAQLVDFAATRFERSAASFLLVLHVAIATPLLAVKSSSVPFGEPNMVTDRDIPRSPDIQTKTVVLVNPPGELFGMVLIASRIARGLPHPEHLYSLAPVTAALEVSREDANTLQIRPPDGFLAHTLERGWRSPEHPLLAGSVVELARMTVSVPESTPDLRPADARFHFDVPLEDQSLLWLRWDHQHFVPWTPPPIGQTIHLPAYGFREFLHDLTSKLSPH